MVYTKTTNTVNNTKKKVEKNNCKFQHTTGDYNVLDSTVNNTAMFKRSHNEVTFLYWYMSLVDIVTVKVDIVH